MLRIRIRMNLHLCMSRIRIKKNGRIWIHRSTLKSKDGSGSESKVKAGEGSYKGSQWRPILEPWRLKTEVKEAQTWCRGGSKAKLTARHGGSFSQRLHFHISLMSSQIRIRSRIEVKGTEPHDADPHQGDAYPYPVGSLV